MMTVLDLFSGIGGFSLGLERTGGFITTAFCEIDEPCRKVLDKHWPEVVKFTDVKTLVGSPGQYDVICGGFPCQDISVAGKQKGLAGERSGLWFEFKRLIKEIRPRYAIIENVANLRSKGLATVLQDLWEIGYNAEWHIISARSVGAPHLRERIWIIAYPNGSRLQRENISEPEERESSTQLVRLCRGGSEPCLQSVTTSNSNSERLERQWEPSRVQEKHSDPDCSTTFPPNPNDFRLWKPFASEEAKQKWWSETAFSVSHWKETQSIVCGVSNGLPRWMERHRKQRIKQLGNTVVPQIPQIIGQAILGYEESLSLL